MAEFIQMHMLVSYPPSNLNRDDLGRPKTAMMGGACRLRVSSQSLKRAWRTSETFEEALGGHLGVRTKEMGWNVYLALKSGKALADVVEGTDTEVVRSPVDEKKAVAWGQAIAAQFGKLKSVKENAEKKKENAEKKKEDAEKKKEDAEKKKKESLCVEQMVHFSPDEIAAIDTLLARCAESGDDPAGDDLNLLRAENSAADIAMFGRMLASSPSFNCEAAVQVAHAITVHRVTVEDDYFTAVDDLNRGVEDVGAGHVGQAEFAAGLYYAYLCINRDLLVENLGGDKALADRAICSLTESAAKVGPKGKQNSFASRAYASYILAERGSQQPRSLSVAFLKPVGGEDYMTTAVAALEKTRDNMEKVYGECARECRTMNAAAGTGSLDEILTFVSGDHA